MKTPRDDAQRTYAYLLYSGGKSAAEIARELQLSFDNPKDPSTIRRWITKHFRDLRARAEATGNQDGPFQLERMEEHGLPWEAASWLLACWRDAMHFAASVKKENGIDLPVPTARRMKWWWRMKLAAPDLEDIDLKTVAGAFERRELASDLGFAALDTSDLIAFLAFKPWQGERAANQYELAVSNGVIPKLRFEPGGRTVGLVTRLHGQDWKPGNPLPPGKLGELVNLHWIPWPSQETGWELPFKRMIRRSKEEFPLFYEAYRDAEGEDTGEEPRE